MIPIAEGAPARRGRLIEKLTFSPEIRNATAAVNRLCAKPFDRIRFFFDGHVSGIKNLVYDKATDMALHYSAICSASRDERLLALARLRDEAFNYQGLEMPYNTRRILIALMKETVKARGDLMRQHRYMAAFHNALSGRSYVVRTMLDELGLAEVPEAAGARSDGWDDQVYDNAGSGRKTPSQLVLDAYIKGLSRLTIVYEDFLETAALDEALEAGRLMGIEVILGLECLVQTREKQRLYHVLLLRGCSTPRELAALFEAPTLKSLQKLVNGNFAEYDRLYAELVRRFNKQSLPIMNEGFVSTAGELKRLSVEGLRIQAGGRPIFHVHLGQLLWQRLAKLREARLAVNPGAENFTGFGAAELRRRFFDPLYGDILAGGDFVKAYKLYAAVADVEKGFGERRIGVVYTRPLSCELDACVRYFLANSASIDALEIWNNRIRREGYAGNARFLEALRRALNRGDSGAAAGLIAAQGISGLPEGTLEKAAERFLARPLAALIGSNSDGYNHLAPGMGFVPRDEIRNWRAVLRANRSAPLPITLPGEGGAKERTIIPLGKDRGASGRPTAKVGQRLSRVRWRDLNAGIRDALRMVGGALLALAAANIFSSLSGFPPSFGLFTVAIFFVITFARNFIVDEIAAHGLHPSRWRGPSFDSTNAANSVFFSFLSIPILRIVEQLLDHFVFAGAVASIGPGGYAGDFWSRLLRFVPLALINGFWIYGHNSLRGFTLPVKRVNFLRSAPAFILATGLSYLNPWSVLISGVIINKLASDIIGGFTEAAFKIRKETKRARQMYADLLPLLSGETKTQREKYIQRLAILDILYVWGRSPRGKEALRKSIAKETSPDAIWKNLETPVRRYETFVRLITEKTAWRKPQKIKLEFLRLAANFSYWLARNRPSSRGPGKQQVTAL